MRTSMPTRYAWPSERIAGPIAATMGEKGHRKARRGRETSRLAKQFQKLGKSTAPAFDRLRFLAYPGDRRGRSRLIAARGRPARKREPCKTADATT
jgi:hypothetical protein